MDSLLGQDDRPPGPRAQHSAWHTGAESSLSSPPLASLSSLLAVCPYGLSAKGPGRCCQRPSSRPAPAPLAAWHGEGLLSQLFPSEASHLALPWTHRSPAVSLMGKSSHAARSSGWPGGLSFPSPSKASDGRQRGQRTACPTWSDPPVKSPHTRSHPPRGTDQAFFSRQRKTNAT